MKITNKINGKEKIYVQKKDIIAICQLNLPVLESIIKMSPIDNFLSGDENDFMEFSKKEEIEYFKLLDFIIDYKKNIKSSPETITKEIHSLIQDERALSRKLKRMTRPERKKNKVLSDRLQMTTHKIGDMIQILQEIEGLNTLNLPLIPDDNSPSYIEDPKSIYELRDSLDKSSKILYRKDDLMLTPYDRRIKNKVEKVILESISNQAQEGIIKEFKITSNLSKDNQYLIVTTKQDNKRLIK